MKAPKKTAAKKSTVARKKTAAKKTPMTVEELRKLAAAWLIKSEPSVYPFAQLIAEKRTSWDGVRNFEARNTLRAMKRGDTLLYYHSNEGKEIVGLAAVGSEAYPDPTIDRAEGDWSSVEVLAGKALARPVTLAAIKAHPLLSKMALVRRSRISVVPVTAAELRTILSLSEPKL